MRVTHGPGRLRNLAKRSHFYLQPHWKECKVTPRAMCWPEGMHSPDLKKRRNKHQGSSFPSEYCAEEPGVWQTVPSITPAGERPPHRKLQFPGIPWTVVGPEFPHAPRVDATCHIARPIADTKDVRGSGWGMGRRLLACMGDVRGELQGLTVDLGISTGV